MFGLAVQADKRLVHQERWPNQGLEESEHSIPETVGMGNEVDDCSKETQEIETARAA